jgi:hypothetical protein
VQVVVVVEVKEVQVVVVVEVKEVQVVVVVEVKEVQVVVVEGEMRGSISLRYAVSRSSMRRIFRRNVDLRVRVVRR